jgi:hypothetical protein
MSSAEDSKPVQKKPMGVGALVRRSTVAKQATAEMKAAVQRPPSGLTDTAAQSFYGDPKPKAQQGIKPANPKPLGLQPVFDDVKEEPPAPAPAVLPARKELRFAKPTPDYRKRQPVLNLPRQQDIDTRLDPIFGQYQRAESEIVSKNPYLTDTAIYTPQSRKSFYRFISDNYSEVFRLIPQIKGKIDEDACAKLEQKAGEVVEGFLYQKFIREYIRNAGPYRGILVYHGLGSGKTCSAIAAAEALYGTSNKKIIVMTPFSLRSNFISEISFCGFRHFNVHNHWVRQPLETELDLMYFYAKSVLNLTDSFLRQVRQRPEAERRAIWIADFSKPSNYNELDQKDRDDIRMQLTAMIDSRIKFISYNGITAAELKRYACTADPETGERFFDNAVIVIDEVHNLTRLMQGEILPYIVDRKKGKRKIPAEPIVPGKWKPGLCDMTLNYKRAYLFYKLLTDARNSKIIGLSGTPIINFPEELGILANVLSGYMECAEVSLMSADKKVMEQFRAIAESEPRVDIVRFRSGDRQMGVLISVFNEGYERVLDPENKDRFVGVRYNEEAQDSIYVVYARIKEKLKAASIPIGEETFVSYPRLPIDDESFRQEFINPVDLSIINKVVLQKRLTGMISYYKGSKEEYMPRVVRDEIIKCEMSEHVLSTYTVERNMEIKGEAGKTKETGDVFAAVELFSKMKNPSSYRFRSRALCNFAFPTKIKRPFPFSKVEEEEMEKEIQVIDENVEVSEMIANSEEDVEAAAQVAAEEAMIEGPEEEDTSAPQDAAQDAPQEVASTAAVSAAAVQGGAFEEEDSDSSSSSDSDSDSSSSSEEEGGDEEYDRDEMVGGDPTDPPKRKKPQMGNVSESAAPQSVAQSSQVEVSVASSAAAPKSVVRRSKPVQGNVPASVVPAVSAPVPVRDSALPIVSAVPSRSRKPVQGNAAAAAQEEAQAVPSGADVRVPTYQERIAKAMRDLDAFDETGKSVYLNLDDPVPESRLDHYSPKLDHMLRRIQNAKGSNLVYSQFKTVEGLGVLGLALKANGFKEIRIDGPDQAPYFTPETIASLQKGPEAREKRFITFTGEGSKDRRNLILNVFNGHFDKLPANMRAVMEPYAARRNNYGEICWVIGITGAGAEGISLKCCRAVHIMEPYWNNVRLDQVKGRAIRICSHKDLPFAERDVEIFTYYTVFSDKQKQGLDMNLKTTDQNETSDEKVFHVSIKKDRINQSILTVMKESAVDCGLNSADNDGVQCFVVEGRADQYLFDPNLEVDKLITNIEMKEVKSDKVGIQQQVNSATGKASAASSATIACKVVEIGGKEYMLFPKANSGGFLLELFSRQDQDFRHPLGEVAVDPITHAYTRMRMYH